MQEKFIVRESINIIHHIHRIKENPHTIISIDAEEAFDKIHHSFMINTYRKLGIEGNFLNVIKGIYENPHLTSYLMVKD